MGLYSFLIGYQRQAHFPEQVGYVFEATGCENYGELR